MEKDLGPDDSGIREHFFQFSEAALYVCTGYVGRGTAIVDA